MIKKMKSKLSIKVFSITALLMAACCTITYLCIVRFAPYIYTYDMSEAEEIANVIYVELFWTRFEEARGIISCMRDVLASDYNDEFVIHIFQSSGEELTLPRLDTFTGKDITDYQNVEKTKESSIFFSDREREYILLLTQNVDKESQVVEALQKSLPVLSVIILSVSVIAAFFYTWYFTKPIKEVSRVSEKMANMDFRSLCPTGRTDEIGTLSSNLNTLSSKLGIALSDLQEANRKLQADIDRERELERLRIEFFSAASHELKTPITIIKGQLQGMLYQVGRYKDRETYLAQSLEVTDTLEKMVQELLTLSRLNTPSYSCKKADVAISRLLNERLTAYEDWFLQKELTVDKFIIPELSLNGDTQLLQKVLDNLIGNAATYSGAGDHIVVKLWEEAKKINLSIENTGAHIPDEDIPRLFEAFYRVEQSRNRQTGGTGLGLYIVKTILDLHGAEIEIANSARGVIVSVQF